MSFRLKTILGIAAIQIVLLSILISSVLNFLNENGAEHLISDANTRARLIGSTTGDAILSHDLAVLESAAREAISNPNIVYIRILSGDFILAEAGFENLPDKQRQLDISLDTVDDGVFDTAYTVEVGGSVYGTVELGYSTDQIDHVFAEIQQWTITISLILILLVSVFSLFLGNYLTLQINKLNIASEIITQKGPGYQIKIEGSDEISEMIKAFNKMSVSLKGSYDQLEQGLAIQNDLLVSANENESKIQAILESSLDALIIIDQDGLIQEYNPKAEAMFGWHRQELFHKPLAAYIIPENMRQAHNRGMAHYLQTGEGPVLGKRLELTAMHKDGHQFPIELTISNIKIDQNELFTAFIRDITARKETETELRLAGRAFESIEAMFISDSSGHIIRVNAAFTKITGFSAAEALGQNPRDFLKSGIHKKPFYDAMWQQIRLNGQWRGEIYNRRKNGEIFPVFLSISAVYDANDTLSHFVAQFQDITERKKNEKKLLSARHQAEQANEAKSRFLATMSHEIRTPLGAVLGILDMLKQSGLTQEQSNLVKTGEQSGRQLLDIINTILDFSRMKAGKLKIKDQPLRLHELFHSTREMLDTQAENKGLTLTLTLAPDIPAFARGDATRIRQILINLINNAIKFTEQGTIAVSCTCRPKDDSHFILTTRVTDTGIGIPEEFQKVLFEEFTMNDESHARKQEGSGLGLAISSQLARLMHGEIRFESNADRGSTFEFHIELAHESEEQVIAHEYQFKPKTEISNKNINVLVAEDNPANQMIFGHYLDSAGISYEMVQNGMEVVDAFKRGHFNLVLMDISMPVKDGISATHEIRNMDRREQPTPIIALTAHTLEEEIRRYRSEGFNDHLAKPCNKENMLSCIEKWTSQDKVTAPPPENKAVEPGEALSGQMPATPETGEAELVDDKVIQQLIRDTSVEIVPELLTFYIDESEKLVVKIQQAGADNDAEALEFHAHTLGSSSGSHAAMQLHLLARKVEHLCREGLAEEAFEQVDALAALAKRSFKALAKVADTLSVSDR